LIKTFVDIAGWSGMLLILVAYALNSLGKMSANSQLYQWMNIVGAAGLIVNSGWNFAWPSATLNVVWLIIGILAIGRLRRRSAIEPRPSVE
jgi:hypothetical protein